MNGISFWLVIWNTCKFLIPVHSRIYGEMYSFFVTLIFIASSTHMGNLQMMNEDLLQDLVLYKKSHEKAVSIAARSLITLFREVRSFLATFPMSFIMLELPIR